MNDIRRAVSREIGVARWNEWKAFQRGVALVSSWIEAQSFGARGPATGNPGSSFYTNLLYFLRYDSVPLGADAAQIGIYDALAARLGGRPPCGGDRP
jgi:hypothetical protein